MSQAKVKKERRCKKCLVILTNVDAKEIREHAKSCDGKVK